MQICTRGLEKFPGSDQFPARLAATLAITGKYEEAIVMQKRLVAVRADDPDAYVSLASFNYYAGHYKETVSAATESIRLRDANPMAYHDLGAAYVKLDRLDDALKAYRRALEFKPQYEGSAEVLIEMANLYTSTKRQREALDAAGQAEQLLADTRQRGPATPTVLERLGDAYNKLDKRDKAVSAWQKALSTSADGDGAARLQSKVNAATGR